jgi:two-component system phosphate regulon sensor histidine kinase PhoR
MRRDFVGNVSHELGTPITVIKGYLETIVDNLDSFDSRWHKPIEQMRSQSQRMENIVRDLLVLSSIETRAAPRAQETIDLGELAEEIKGHTQEIMTEKQHSFSINCPNEIILLGQRSELYSALSNLVINAAKYTPAGGCY